MIIVLGQQRKASAVNKGERPEKQNGNGRVKFPEKINYEVDIEGEVLTVEAERQATPHSMMVVSSSGASQELNFEVQFNIRLNSIFKLHY